MTLKEVMDKLAELGQRIQDKAGQITAACADTSVSMDQIKTMQGELADLNERRDALQRTVESLKDEAQQRIVPGIQPVAASRELSDILKSREYARAFAYAIKNGISPKRGRGNEHLKVLYDALTESGGSPTGTDGGFLVPEDIDQSIREYRRALDPLAEHFNQETVTAPTGWRVVDTAPTTALVDLDEMEEIDDDDDQPAFSKVPYTVGKYGLILPVSNELMTDNVSNLFSYISRWFAKKLVITENALLLTKLQTLTGTSVTSAPVAGIKTALNVSLDPAISNTASIFVNQSCFDVLDQLVDENGRPLLAPDLTNASARRFAGRPVVVLSNSVMPDYEVTTGSGESAVTNTLTDIFVGDGREFATLFRCGGYEVTSTEIGGDAWRTDSTEVRGIARLGVSTFDTSAMVRCTITLE